MPLRTLLLLLCFPLITTAQNLYFPPVTGNTWATTSPASLGWCTEKVDSLYQFLEEKNSKAFILLVDGRIVLEKYFGTFTQDSAWYWASAGKTLTAFIVGMAQQEGYLSIHDTTAQYLGAGWTACTPEQEARITVWHQLSMTSGLDDGVPDHYCTLDTCLVYKADAGTRWAYHNGPYTLLDAVVENATGQNLNAFSNTRLKAPTGISGSFFTAGYNNVFFSKPRSMARFGLLILNKGNWNGTQLLTDTAYFHQMVNTSQNLNPSYGYLWWLNGKSTYKVPGLQFDFPGPLMPQAPADAIAALGKNGQIINVVPSRNMVWIRMGNEPGGGEVPFTLSDDIWGKLNTVICNTSSTDLVPEATPAMLCFPNPVPQGTAFEVKTRSGLEASVAVFNLVGQKITGELPLHGGYTKINTAGWPAGVYTVALTSEKRPIQVQKIVVY